MKYILISEIPQKDIEAITSYIEDKVMVNFIPTPKEEQEKEKLDKACEFGFVYSIDCNDTQYFNVIKHNCREISKMKPKIIAIDSNFNDIYTIYKNGFLKENFSDETLNLSDLSNRAKLKNKLNEMPFAQSLYFLCYRFQFQGIDLEELILNNNNINDSGFNIFFYLQQPFFPSLKIAYFIGNNDLSTKTFNSIRLASIKIICFPEKIELIARQTDLTPQTVNAIVNQYNFQDKSMSFIVNEIRFNEHLLKPDNYVSSEAFDLHHLHKIETE